MKKIGLLIFVILLFAQAKVFSQTTINGEIRERATQKILKSAYVSLINSEDSTKRKTVPTDGEGKFTFSEIIAGNYALRVSFLGYNEYRQNLTVGDSTLIIPTIFLDENSKELNEVKVIGQVAATIQKVDTLQFNAKAFKVNPDAMANDLLEKLPGAMMENGKLQIQGDEVKQVMIDGKLFFGKDATAALKNIPSEVIDKIQVFDQLSEQSQLSGLDDGIPQKPSILPPAQICEMAFLDEIRLVLAQTILINSIRVLIGLRVAVGLPFYYNLITLMNKISLPKIYWVLLLGLHKLAEVAVEIVVVVGEEEMTIQVISW